MKNKSKWLVLAVMPALLVAGGTLLAPLASADCYVTHQLDPVDNFSDLVIAQNAGVTSAKWKTTASGSNNIQFDLDLAIAFLVCGGQHYPQWVTYGVTATTGPSVPQVYFDGDPAKTTFRFDASGPLSKAKVQVNIIAPAGDGAYTAQIGLIEKGGDGSIPLADDGITIGFAVSNATGCAPAETSLSLALDPSCLVYKETSAKFTATLTDAQHRALAREAIDFTIDGVFLGSRETDEDGAATLTFDPSGLSVGAHSVVASFQGEECYLKAEPDPASLGVRYDFLGFQPPVKTAGGDTSLFTGKIIPVKIRIADADGSPVPDAKANLTWTGTIAQVAYANASTESVSAADSGNRMRYDPVADQYLYNWNVSSLVDGLFVINVDMGEGCGSRRNATVLLQKGGGKKN